MVGDLVVIDVVDIDALCSPAHLFGDDGCVEIPLQDVGGGAESGVGPSPVNARQDVEPVLSGSLPALLRQLGDRTYHPSSKSVGVGEEPGERLPCNRGPVTPAKAAHRQDGTGASPVKRFPRASPSSASNPTPFVARCSMIAASSGRFAIKTRPSSRSYHRNAGTPATVPCRIPS